MPDLTIDTTKEKIKLILRDKESDTSNTYEQVVEGSYDGQHQLDIKVENIRLVEGDYSVKVSSQLISEWTNQDDDLTYYIALEP